MNYKIQYTPEAEKDVRALQKAGDKSVILKLRKLLIELSAHPYMGTGKPKPLGGDRVGQWSRRITDKHRLVYVVNDDKILVLIISAAGHYGDR
jgi:toxin YoeB